VSSYHGERLNDQGHIYLISATSTLELCGAVYWLTTSSTVACSIVASRLHYCNALLSGAPAATFNKLQRAQNNLARVVCQSRGRTDDMPLLHSLHWLPVRQRVTYKLAVLTHKVRTTANSHSIVSQQAGTDPCTALGSALFRCFDARRSSRTHRTGPSRFFCCCSIHLEFSTCWHSTVQKHSHFQTPLENPSIQTHLVLPVLHQAPLYLRT